jgi:hypothetical protein
VEHLNDKQAKEVFLSAWPGNTRSVWAVPSGATTWIRAQPKQIDYKATTPLIRRTGLTHFKTQPDCLYVAIEHRMRFADVICLEVCGNRTNFLDKRSRYSASTSALTLSIESAWLDEPLHSKKTRAEYFGISVLPVGPTEVPIRYLRVLYSVPTELYQKIQHGVALEGHEYMCEHSSLKSIRSKRFIEFLRRMDPETHYYTQMYRR